VIVPPLLLVVRVASMLPSPERVAPDPMVRPAVSVSVPFEIVIKPSVILSAALMVRLPLLPISSV
jgi:hypothetical protein